LPAKKQKIKKPKNMEEMAMEKIRNFFKDDSGATMVEYGLMIALIAVVCFTAVGLLGTNASNTFDAAATKLVP
jgi:pilus assembly protein Flp/PilA